MILRRLNGSGIDAFRAWIRKGARGVPPVRLIRDGATAMDVGGDVSVDEKKQFADRYEFGQYLVSCLEPLDNGRLETDEGIWAALALLWFDQVCPRRPGGGRRPTPEYLFLLSRDWREEYRHMVKPCWQLVRDHGEDSRLMLLARTGKRDSLRRRGEVFEHVASRKSLFLSSGVVSTLAELYSDPKTGRPIAGVASKGGGTIRRMGVLLRQLERTYDLDSVPAERLAGLLPNEFEKWKRQTSDVRSNDSGV